MRVFVQDHDLPPEQSVRRALEILLEAGIYKVDGGGIFGDRALVLVDPAHVREAVAALNKAGLRAVIG